MGSLFHRLIDARYGTYRGMIRLWLAHAEAHIGHLDTFRHVDLDRVDRLVFVCLGNICRSPYAELLAREYGLPAASFGLSTTTGIAAHPDSIATANALGRDLKSHLATDLADFAIRDSDLLLVMEVRQARALRQRLEGSQAQVALLGFWSKPRRPHIHDPMTLSGDYFLSCYLTIESAVKNLANDFQQRLKTNITIR